MTYGYGGIRVALLVVGLVILTPPAVGAAASRTDFDVRFSSAAPGTDTGLAIKLRYRAEGDPEAKPEPVNDLVLDLPEGTVLGTGSHPPCTATDAELRSRGRSACPAESRLGGGTLTVMTGFPGAGETETDVTIFRTADGFLELVQAKGSDTTLGMDRATVEGTRVTFHPPATPGGPPDGRTAVRAADVVFDPGYITTPPVCRGGWTFRGAFTYNDGFTDLAEDTQACRRPRLRMTVTPARTLVGRATSFRVRLRSSSAACVEGARVVLAGRRFTGDTMRHTFRAPGRFRIRARAPGCRPAARAIAVTRG